MKASIVIVFRSFPDFIRVQGGVETRNGRAIGPAGGVSGSFRDKQTEPGGSARCGFPGNGMEGAKGMARATGLWG